MMNAQLHIKFGVDTRVKKQKKKILTTHREFVHPLFFMSLLQLAATLFQCRSIHLFVFLGPGEGTALQAEDFTLS